MNKNIRKYFGLAALLALGANAWAENVAKIGTKEYETLAEAFSAVKAGETIEIVKAGEYVVDSVGGAGYSVVATVGGVVFKRENIKQYPYEDWISGCSDTVTLSNLTWKIGAGYYSHFKKIHAIDCRFEGRMYCENGVVFDNCTFVKEPGDYPIYTYHGGVTFNQCTFDCGGKCINVYSEIRGGDKTPYVVTVNGCTFKNSGAAKKAAILVKEYVDGSSEHYFDIILQGKQTLVGEFPSGSYESEVTFAYGGGIIAVEAESEAGTGHVRIFEGIKTIYPAAAEEPEVVPEKPTAEKVEEATKVVDESGKVVTPSAQQEAAAKTEVEKVAQSFDNPEIAKVETHVAEAATTVSGEGEEQKVVVKSAIVEELQKAAPGDTAVQITPESDVKSYVKVALNEAKVAVKEEGAALKSVTFDVKPMAETTVTVGTDTTVVKVQIPNDEIVNPITFRLPLTDAFTVSAIVTHEGDPDRLCMVQGAPGGRYVEVTASHFSFFTVTPSEIVETTTESKTVLGIKRVDYTVTQSTADLAAAVPWLKAADEDMPVSQLITTGLSNGDTIQVYDLEQKTYYSWRYNGTAWEAVALSTGVEVPPADDYFLKRGRAFWYKPVGGKGASGTYTQVGLYSEASITSKVDSAVVGSASFAKPVHFLMASPKYEDFDLKEKLTADAGCRNDDVILIVATGKRLTFNGTVWCESVVTEVPRPFGKGTYKKTVLQEVESAVVPAGTAFWYLSAGGAPEFEW